MVAGDASFDAVILAGGRGRRLGGADKPGLLVGERSLLARVVAAVGGAGRVVVAGPPRHGLPGVRFVREDPPGSGPVPALRAALPAVTGQWVALLAADLPYLTSAHVSRLREAGAAAEVDGALYVDGTGQEQWLAGVWHTPALRAALAAYDGRSLRGLLRPLAFTRVTAAPSDGPPPWRDCDTTADLTAARAWAAGPGSPDR